MRTPRLLEFLRLREICGREREMGTAVVATVGLSCSSNLALATPSAHHSTCQATQLCAVKPVNYGAQPTSRSLTKSSPSSVGISSGLRVGRSLGQLGSIRHEYGYHELMASVVAHYGNGRSAGGALASEMNIFSRIARIFRSYIEQFVGSGEDPERIIDQAVEDMNTDLVKLRQTAAQVVAAKRILENKYNVAQQASDDWYKRAARALEKGDEALAKEALKRRKAYADSAKSLKSQLDQQVSVSDRILSSTRVLESKIYEARNKKDLLKARAQSAKTSKEVNEVLGSVDTTSALSAYKRMEEKVERLEAEADAVTQMASDELGSKFAQLEMDVDVDDDLKSLKRDLLGSSSTTAQLRGELPIWEREAIRSERRRDPESYKQF